MLAIIIALTFINIIYTIEYSLGINITNNIIEKAFLYLGITSFVDPIASLNAFVSILCIGVIILYNYKDNKIIYVVSYMVFVYSIYIITHTGIRSAWPAMFIGVLSILYFNKNYKVNTSENPLKKAVSISAIIAIFFLLLAFLYLIRPESVHGRILIWKISIFMLIDNPVYGIGYNNFSYYYNLYQAEYFSQGQAAVEEILLAGNVQHAHNEYLEIAVEMGILTFIIIFTILIYTLFSNPYSSTYKCYSKYIIIYKSSIMALLTSAFFSLPLSYLFICMLLLFIYSSHSIYISIIYFKTSENNISKYLKILPHMLMIALLTVFNFSKAYYHYSQIQHADKIESLQINNKYVNGELIIYGSLYRDNFLTSEDLFRYGSYLYSSGNYSKSEIVLLRSISRFSDPNLFLLLASVYEKQGYYGYAKYYYLKSWHIQPNRIFPLYSLMMMAINMEDSKLAYYSANKIIDNPIKIESYATRQIRLRAIEYLNSKHD